MITSEHAQVLLWATLWWTFNVVTGWHMDAWWWAFTAVVWLKILTVEAGEEMS